MNMRLTGGEYDFNEGVVANSRVLGNQTDVLNIFASTNPKFFNSLFDNRRPSYVMLIVLSFMSCKIITIPQMIYEQ